MARLSPLNEEIIMAIIAATEFTKKIILSDTNYGSLFSGVKPFLQQLHEDLQIGMICPQYGI